MTDRLELALYGKGGIGKSTMSANLSAALAAQGVRVMQIGCDPKHDSTRLLLGGRVIPTVLDRLRDDPAGAALKDVLFTGWGGVGCIEAGGPRPGVGCAGRGIISAFEFLEKHRAKDDYDVVLYDVLGDVVCGGFAVPIRREYADAILLVTSGEFMALYAANNILRGIRSFDGDDRSRVAGILLNERDVPDERARVERFARAVRLPIVARAPRSEAFLRAEEHHCTLAELDGWPEERAVFTELAGRVRARLPLHRALPLTDEELERVVLGQGGRVFPVPGVRAEETSPPEPEKAAAPAPTAETAPPSRPALYGCAFTGAATTAVHLTDAVVIAHSPRSCAFYTWQNISSTGRKNLFNRGILMPSAISPNFETTELGHAEAVFGGMDRLREKVADAVARRPGAVIVISSCVSGIIGDDITSLGSMGTPETPVIVIPADGDISGDYMSGIEACLHRVAEGLADPSVPTRPFTVNLIGEAGVGYHTDVNHRTVKALLEGMGVGIGCRFLGDASAEEVRNLTAAPLNILAADTADNRALRAWLEARYGLRFFHRCLPIGFEETRDFLRELADFFGVSERAEPVIAREEAGYRARVEELRPVLAGRRILMTTINANMDWLLDAAEGCGMEFCWIGVLNYLRQEMKISEKPSRMAVAEEITGFTAVHDRIRALRPDLVISNYTSVVEGVDCVVDNMPMTQPVGFQSGLSVLSRWALLLEHRREGGWRDDKALFEKYFA